MDRSGLKAELSLHSVAPQTGPAKDDAPPFPLDERSHPARQVPAHDVDAEKRKERDALRAEVARLRRDLQVVNKENEHIRLMQSSGRVISSQDEDAVLDVIQRHMVDAENPAPPPASQQLAKAALSSAGLGLLPFTRPTPLVVAPEEQDFADIKSHRPVPMTAEEELPYLQLFSPFAVTSTIAVLPQLPNQPLRQRRTMTFRPKDGLGLFTARVELVIDALDLSILELKVPALEPAARAELAPFADKICQGDCNRSMQRNVGILSWAMGEWYRVSLRRARLWSQLENELAAKGGVLQATTEMRKRKKRRRRDEESDGEEDAPAAVSMKPATLRHLLGQQFFDLSIPPREASDPSSSLRLEWKIEFDWTGEAKSRVAFLVGVPGKSKTMAALLAGDRVDSTD
ncbi:hypothetical protein ESCO_005622 [Escovopsis weberi]|uniref:Uncharacterized protein n=1 Tax=Escovopsis weberi TaxID=150374 RepID=A0A0N0RTJ2_ESCWE|nr:hypothetical protein ESCO_005622 [Escovopsis weberi]